MADDSNELSIYEVDQNGVTHTLQLTEDDAKRYGDAARKVGSVAPSDPADEPEAKAKAQPPNKTRQAPSNK